jgi:hypothetical protein
VSVAPERRLGGPLFWVTAVAGWAVIAYGIRGLLHHHIDTRPTNLATFAVGGALLHDLLFAPVVLLFGVAIARAAPKRWRAELQAALVISGCLALFAYPLVRNYARVLHNPSSLPHNYTANLAIVIGVVWVVAALIVLVRGRVSAPGRERPRTRR